MDVTSIKQSIFGKPKDVHDPNIFHKLALIPTLAWIGLGADGLSSSSYGPEEAFRVIVDHPYLAVLLAIATAFTVFIIAYSYSKMIEYFPTGGGGYVVATQTLGKKAGVVSGSALIVDYILTITVSIAACGDAIFSFLPMEYHQYKLMFQVFLVLMLIVMNIRGVKESIYILAPVFVVFIITHILLIGYGIIGHAGEIGSVVREIKADYNSGLASLGTIGMMALFFKAYSMGGGTYTGIEAVSNGLQIMKEPKVKTAKRTMVYMSLSLAITAGGLLFCYLLWDIKPEHGKTMNALLSGRVFETWAFGGMLALITIFSEGALLTVAAQAGFIDGPRVMANMALDGWLPKRFASLSERLTMRDGVLLMGFAAILVLLYTGGHIGTLVVMYSINVFVTFSLSQLGMCKFFIVNRKTKPEWRSHLFIHLVGLLLCTTILAITCYEKFGAGGWLTLVFTSIVVIICYLIKKHYNKVSKAIKKLNEKIIEFPPSGFPYNKEAVKPEDRTAIQLVSGFNSFGVHSMLSILDNFPWVYKNFIFVGVAAVDSGSFKNHEELVAYEENVKKALRQYVEYARKLGMPADYRFSAGTDVVELATELCINTAREFPKSTVFAGKLTFQEERFYHKMLHNDTAFMIQKNLQQYGVTTVILPVTVDLKE